MKIVVAPVQYELQPNETACFLAGGITNCPNWQNVVLHTLDMFDKQYPGKLDDLVVFNPRRENFPIDDHIASSEQIKWEFKYIELTDIFSMFFADNAIQPICLYELGRNVAKIMSNHPLDYEDRLLVTCTTNYSRRIDVETQLQLAIDSTEAYNKIVHISNDLRLHTSEIIDRYLKMKKLVDFNEEMIDIFKAKSPYVAMTPRGIEYI